MDAALDQLSEVFYLQGGRVISTYSPAKRSVSQKLL
jgi:hypothetical protein